MLLHPLDNLKFQTYYQIEPAVKQAQLIFNLFVQEIT